MVIKEDIFQVSKDTFVDVIMPNYNKGNFLEETINSVILQEYKNWNLFIIDNSSTDNSKIILNKFKNIQSKINLIYLHKNKGVAFSRNLGIRLSNSKYIAFVDSDDYWSPSKLKDQIYFMEKFNYSFTYTDYVPFTSKNNKKFFKKSVITPDSFNYEQFINDTSIHTSTMVLKRSIINTIKFPKLKSFEDYCFKCTILKRGHNAIKFKQSSMFYRISKNSLSSSKIKNFYWLWFINKKYNKLSFLQAVKSALLVSISSIKKYGFK